jgi:hypothetical protein
MRLQKLLLASTLVGCAAMAQATPIVTVDFETPAAPAFTVVSFDNGGNNDFVINFDYDYVAAGIPLAPNSMGGTKGLFLQVNSGDVTGSPAGVNAIINLAPPNDNLTDYTLKFDVYCRWVSGTGTSEFFYYGSSTGTSPVWGGGLTSATWNGFAFGQCTEGGFTSDYVYYEGVGDTVSKPNVYAPHLPQWWGIPTAPPSNPTFNNLDASWQTFFDIATTGTAVAGVATNIWLTVELEVQNGNTAYVYFTPPGKSRTLVSKPAGITIGNGPTTFATPEAAFTGIDVSNPFIGYADINTSISSTDIYAVFDNVQVILPSSVPEWSVY